MITPAEVSAVIPTRGDQDLTEIIESLSECAEVIIWDNSVEEDLSVWGRYAAMSRASMPVIYTQDDDCIVDVERVCHYYEPRRLTANMPVARWKDYADSALVGWGSVFDIDMPVGALGRFGVGLFGWDAGAMLGWLEENVAWFRRTCDVVFSTLVPRQLKVDVGFSHLPWAETEGRMFKTPGHKEERDAMLALARKARDARP